MKTFFATFGANHAHANCFVEVVAHDHHAARFYMISEHRDQWTQKFTNQRPDRLRRLTKVFQAAGKELRFTTGRRTVGA